MSSKSISAATELTSLADGDLLPVVDISEAAAADKNKKLAVSTLKSYIGGSTFSTRAEFSAWSSGTTYNSADGDIFVTQNSKVYQYIKAGTSLNETPATYTSVWSEIFIDDRAVLFETDEFQLNQVTSYLVLTGNI